MDLTERGQKLLLVLASLILHYGRLSLVTWEKVLFAAQGQLDFHPMPSAKAPGPRTEFRLTNYSGRRPGASAWIARFDQSVYFLVANRKMTSGEDTTEAGYFIRPYKESRGWVVRSLRSRKLVVTCNGYVIRDLNTRHAQLALSDHLVGRHGSLDTEPGAYLKSIRRLFATCLDLPASSALVVDDPLSGIPIALVPALSADQEHVLVPEST